MRVFQRGLPWWALALAGVAVAPFAMMDGVAVAARGWQEAAQRAAPVFEVDPTWPKPLPNNWSVGPVSGIAADSRDHIWIVQRTEPVKQAGRVPAPPVIEFDPDGNVVRAWGGPGAGYEWLEQVHGISIDEQSRIWITGNGTTDAQILAFTADGQFLMQIGRSGMSGGNSDTTNVGRATQARFDAAANEVYVSDGERSAHRRVIVFDGDRGTYKRHWGAYGRSPADVFDRTFDPKGPPATQFVDVHCLRLGRDGLVYVCDRNNSRVQIFRKDGTFVRERVILNDGARPSVWDLDFSPDQRFMYVADGSAQRVWILFRDSLEIVGFFGGAGEEPGRFATSLHDITVDSKGNIYTGEAATGGRVQRFLLKR